VGAVSADPVPMAKISASRTHGVTSPARARAPSATAAASMRAWATSRKRRRSTRSPIAPAATANSMTGRLPAVETRATYTAEPVSDSISHWAPTVCIQLPMLLTNWADHISANSGCRNGAQAEPGAGAAAAGAGAGAPGALLSMVASVL